MQEVFHTCIVDYPAVGEKWCMTSTFQDMSRMLNLAPTTVILTFLLLLTFLLKEVHLRQLRRTECSAG